MKKIIEPADAPKAIGPYSPGVKIQNTVYFSGQISLDPKTMLMIKEDISSEATQVFKNLETLCQAGGGNLNDIVKLTIYLTDLKQFSFINDVMALFFNKPYPARTTIEVSALPKEASIEVDAIMVIESLEGPDL